MICPMKFSPGTLGMTGKLNYSEACQCEGEKCAWWDDAENRCVIWFIGYLRDIAKTLEAIESTIINK